MTHILWNITKIWIKQCNSKTFIKYIYVVKYGEWPPILTNLSVLVLIVLWHRYKYQCQVRIDEMSSDE